MWFFRWDTFIRMVCGLILSLEVTFFFTFFFVSELIFMDIVSIESPVRAWDGRPPVEWFLFAPVHTA